MICRGGGIGIRGRLRACAHLGVRVQVPLSAQKIYTNILTYKHFNEIFMLKC